MKKIIQITTRPASEFSSSDIFALTEDGKVYYWGNELKIVSSTSNNPIVKSTGERRYISGWIELVNGLII